MAELKGKTAIVTGASEGIGGATVLELASHGVTVIAAARNLEKLNDLVLKVVQSGGSAHAVRCDVSDFKDLVNTVELSLDLSGRLDILINNAGLIDPIVKLADSDPEQWTKVADVNYKGVYFGIRAAIPQMLRSGQGVIVNVSSGAASNPREGWSHYCSSKAGALMITKMVHHEYAHEGIRVVGLSPGTVSTNMQVSIRRSGLNPISKLDPSVHAHPSSPAKIISWLCTEDAKEFDGGDVSLQDEKIQRRSGII